jgi:hypothetical protein
MTAELVDAISAPAAAVARHPDANPTLSPESWLARAGKTDEALARVLADRPSNDAVLQALARAVPFSRRRMPGPTGMTLRARRSRSATSAAARPPQRRCRIFPGSRVR